MQKKKWLQILLLGVILLFAQPVAVQAKEINVSDYGAGNSFDNLRDALNAADPGDTIILNVDGNVNDIGSDSAPWVIDKNITIKGGTLNLRPGGIVLGANVRFENVTLSFGNADRNVIAANGYTLELHNTTYDIYANQVHLLCGTMYTTNGMIGSVKIPTPGGHGQVIVTSDKEISLGNIYAGSIFMSVPDALPSIPATIKVNVATNSKIGLSNVDTTYNYGEIQAGIYATGALQTQGPGISFNTGYVQHPPVPSTTYAVNDDVTIELSVRGSSVTKVDGETGGTKDADVIFTGGEYLVSGMTLTNLNSLSVKSGKFAPGVNSDLSDTDVSVSGTARMIFENLTNPVVNNLTASDTGTIVLKQSQTLTITGTVNGKAKVSIGEYNADESGRPIADHEYIKASGSQPDSFEFWPLSTGENFVLENKLGVWTAVEGDNIIKLEYVSINDHSAYSDEAGVKVEIDTTGLIMFIPVTIRLDGTVLEVAEYQDTGGYIYTNRDKSIEMYLDFNNDLLDFLHITGPGPNGELNPGTYEISIEVPAINMEDGQVHTASFTLTVNDRNPGSNLAFTDSNAYDIPTSTIGTPISDIDVSGGVSGGSQPYTFSATNLPDGITISPVGLISGTPQVHGAERDATITVTDNTGAFKTIQIKVGAVQAVGNHTITTQASPAEGGSVTASTSGAQSGQQVTLEAVPSPDWEFSRWESTDIQLSAPTDKKLVFNMPDKNVSVTAIFTQIPALTFTDNAAYNIPSYGVGTQITPINVSGSVSGGVLPYQFSAQDLPAGLSINNDGLISGTVTTPAAAGTATITVTDARGSSKSIDITVGEITASTVPPTTQYSITTVANPVEGGRVTASVNTAPEGQTILLTATPNAGWIFKGWQGTGVQLPVTASTSIQMLMPANAVTVTAIFEQIQVPQITITASPTALTGGGKVTLTLNNVPEGKVPVVSATGGIAVTGSGNSWSATLPNTTAQYTFTVTVDGKAYTCTVQVTASSTPGGTTPGGNTGGGTTPGGNTGGGTTGGGTSGGSTSGGGTTGGGTSSGTSGSGTGSGGSTGVAGSNASPATKPGQTSAPATTGSQGVTIISSGSNKNKPSESRQETVHPERDVTDEKQENNRIPEVEWKVTDNAAVSSIEQQIFDRDGNEFVLVNERLDESQIEEIWTYVSGNAEAGKALDGTTGHMIMEIYLKNKQTGEKVTTPTMVTFLLHYPEGTDETYEFVVIHLQDGKNPVVLQEVIDYSLTEDGFLISVDNMSPFVVGWKNKEVQEVVPKSEEAEQPSVQAPETVEPEEEGGGILWLIVAIVVVVFAAGIGYFWYLHKRDEDDYDYE